MKIDNLNALYLAELEEFRSVEAQMARHLDEFAGQATNAALSDAIERQKEQTTAHRERLSALLEAHNLPVGRHDDASMHAIITETGKWIGMIEDGDTRDAALIGSLQRMDHYEIAVLGTLANWAGKLGHQHDATVLSEILEQDRQINSLFSRVADEVVNPAAL